MELRFEVEGEMLEVDVGSVANCCCMLLAKSRSLLFPSTDMRWIEGLANAARAPPADKKAEEVLVDGLRECEPNGMAVAEVVFPCLDMEMMVLPFTPRFYALFQPSNITTLFLSLLNEVVEELV